MRCAFLKDTENAASGCERHGLSESPRLAKACSGALQKNPQEHPFPSSFCLIFSLNFWGKVSAIPGWLWTHSVAKDNLELPILRPLPLDCRHELSHPVSLVLKVKPKTLLIPEKYSNIVSYILQDWPKQAMALEVSWWAAELETRLRGQGAGSLWLEMVFPRWQKGHSAQKYTF